MITKYRILSLYAGIFIAWIIFGSNASNPPNAHTNAPFDQFCTRCHSPSGAFDGTLEVSGIPATVNAGETYSATITITATQGSPVRGGFQLVTVFSSNNSNAGNITTSGTSVGTSSSGGRQYLEHRGAKNFSGNTVSWDFDWTAPDGPDGAMITMYYAGNLTNGNGGSSGDKPISDHTSFILSGSNTPLVAGISNQVNVSCNGDNNGSATVDPSGGTPPYTYNWSNGTTNATASALSAGTYGVTVTDVNSMTASTSVSIDEPETLTVSINGEDALCHGDASGSATANAAGGTASYRYAWSNGKSTRTISDLAAGSYQVTVTDDQNCTAIENIQINEPTELQLTISSTDESAPMSSDGTAMVSASGGMSPYSYQWNTGSTGSTLQNLASGTYSVTVSDANQCEAIALTTVQGMECILEATINTSSISCFGASDGSASVVSNVQSVTYKWSDGQTTAEASGLSAGMYDVTITDQNGCEKILATMITEPDSLTLEFTTTDPSCIDQTDGSVEVIIHGGTGPYTIAWSDGQDQPTISNLGVGTYHVTITDSSSCQYSDSTLLIVQDTIAPILVSQPGTIYLDSMGQATVPLQLPFVGGTDDCGIDTMWSVPNQFSCTPSGEQDVTYFARDGSGNIREEIQKITVLDTIRPVFSSCVEDIEADSGSVIEYELPVAFDNCGIDSFALAEGLPSGSVFPPVETKVSYMAVDASGNYECCSFFVRIGGTVSSIDQAFSNQITIYPNPVENELQIEVSALNKPGLRVQIFSIDGDKIREYKSLEKTSTTIRVPMQNIKTGMYFVRIISEAKIAVRKIIKK
ncbi:MAG: T9SS type A sorting domain-containing protein [Saprospiraceae bacterium]|nr:T9SS type A sorting domain-containing protein [Saprospiraceae bacterium]